jgi:NAD(P)-dependent dehydrogenase (short-subunit alcohol dehydrogenase family)
MTGERRVVLITGCSSGFGLATSVAAARRGWRVFATMRDPGRRAGLDAAAAAAGVSVEVTALDVADERSVERGVAAVFDAAGGRLDAIVNNAGIADAGFFEDAPQAQLRQVMETNFLGAAAVTRAALPSLRRSPDGRIVLVSSVAAFSPQAGLSAYVASKWAMEGWAESLAIEVAPFGVRVILVEPGAYRTAIWGSAVVTSVPGSPYAAYRDTMEPRFRAMIDRTARDPAEAGQRIARLLDDRRPPFRNPVGPDARAARLLARVVPVRARMQLLARMAGIPARRQPQPAPVVSSPAADSTVLAEEPLRGGPTASR